MARYAGALVPVVALGLLPVAGQAQLSLYTALDLARRNSPAVHLAQADVARATAGLAESRDAYLPGLTVGSSLGYSYGFPVGQPSIVNVQAQSLVVSFSQPDYIRAARAALRTAQLNLQDSLDQVALDTALDYIQLDTIARQLKALDEQRGYAARLSAIEQQRVDAGVESRMNATRAELNAAQADLRRLDLEAQGSLLRERLAHRTGLTAANMVPKSETIPGEPLFGSSSPGAAARPGGSSASLHAAGAGENAPENLTGGGSQGTLANPAGSLRAKVASVDAGFANAQSKHFLAHGDDHQNYRPLVSFGINYSRYAKFNNYAEYYQRFQHNNFDVGVQVQMPFFDPSKSAHARGSAADALHADMQAIQARDSAQEQVVQLAGSLRELHAQQKVAQLQDELAGEQLESVLTQLQSGSPAPGAAPLSPAEEMQARVAERQRYTEMLDAGLQLTRVELTLLRAVGGMEEWVHTASHIP